MLLGMLLALVAACSQSDDVKKQKAFERGEAYLKAGKFNESIIEFRNALQVDPNFVPALHALGRAYAAKSWFIDAGRELNRAQKLAPDSVPIAVDLGKALLEIGAFGEAEEQVKLILTRDPDDRQALTIRAGALLGEGKSQEALELLKSVPLGGDPEIDRIRADILLNAGRLDEADTAYRAVLASNPDELKTLIGLGAISLKRRKLDEARDFYAHAKANYPNDPRPSMGLAATMAQQGNLSDAIKELEEVHPRAWTFGGILALGQYYLQGNRPIEAVKLLSPLARSHPQFVQARYLLGKALFLSGDPSALAQFEELDRQLPNDPLVRLWLASLYTKQGRPREALEKLDSIAKQAEKVPAYHLERGRALLLLGRLDDAAAAGSAAQRLAPQSPEPYVLMGQTRAQRGDLKGAEGMFMKATEVDATFVPAYLAAGQLHLSAKDVKTALKDFDAAVKAAPSSLEATTLKATTLVQQKRLKEAIDFVEEAAKGNKRVPGFNSLLGNLYMADGEKDKAAASFREALKIDPKNPSGHLGLTLLAMAEGKDEDAVVHLQTVVKERPDDLTSVLLLRALYERVGRPAQAIPMLEAAVRADPRQLAFVLGLSEVYFNLGRYDDALGRTSDVLARQPDLIAARLVRGQAYLAKGDTAGALREFQEAVRSSPQSASAHAYLARVLVRLGRREDAQAEYRQAIKLEPRLALAKRELATLRGEKQDERSLEEEINQLRAVTSNDPRNVVARESLALAYFERGRMKEAEGALKQVLELAPTLAESNYLMARILFGQNKEDEAAPYLRAALRSNPSHVGSNILLGGYLVAKGQREQAMRPLELALSVNPNLAEAKLLLANLYAQSGRFSDALGLVQDLHRADPKAARPLVLIGALQLAGQNPRAAIDAFEKSLKLNAHSIEARRGLGQAYFLLGEHDRAEASYREALKLEGNDVVSLNDLAWILVEVRGKPDQALPLAAKAQQLAPNVGGVIDTLGWIHYRRESYGEAETLLLQAAERAPSNGLIQFHLGMTYAKLGRKDDAASAFRRAVKLDPKLADREKIDQRIKELES